MVKIIIKNGPYAGQTLDQVWTEHRELFGEFPSKDFPLLAKIVDAESRYLFMFTLMILMPMKMRMVNTENQNAGT